MKNYSKILAAIFIFSMSGCDILDPQPISDISSENFFQSAEHVEAAMSATYDVLQSNSIGRDFKASATAGSDEADTDPGSGGNNNRMNRHEVNADHGPARDLWRELYQGIHRANDILERLPGVSDPALEINNKREQLLGEAHFLRGFFYWNLAKWYGDVPIILQTTTSSDPDVLNVERDPLPEVYDQIIADLTFAEANLPESYETNQFTRGRATTGAAAAVLSKVYLRRAYTEFAGSNDFEMAAASAQRVIDNPNYSLVAPQDFFSMFAADGGNTVESIFEIQTENIELNSGDDLYREFEASENGPRARARIIPNQKLIDAYNANPGDIRKDAVLKPMDPAQNSGFEFYINKHDVGEGQLIPNLVILRLADIILVRAEALNAIGQTPEAINLLNMIRDRAQIGNTTATTPDEVFQAIQDERFVELAFEGHRWHDLSRFPANNFEWGRNELATAAEVSFMDENQTYQFLWPINNRELDINKNLRQNPGYN
ncbi:RagB/SusD family nutrient uptake outer membrane protein [Marinigracilibium pacificum]|uniref:RagB/SusD family nutrient uptake outer membrane protein n=1 Tax=Marinigracilibium pacificum TaxID=2729599 RepID=A0A848IZA8_9BACT|nr:RagB/SusD family nutrient uptake outer membrane protein [Marinigracilibium pacificum]NMM47554.1 RagB/SusD family nutrient uptake outer membrane protein [Marinigracilibium pacificum]